MDRVTWSVGPGTSRPLRLLWYLGASVWGGFLVLAVGVAVAFAVAGLAAGDPGPALLVALLVLVGGPFSVRYLWPILTDAEQRPAFLTPPEWLDLRWLAFGSVVCAGCVALVPAAAIVLFAGGIVAGFGSAFLRSEGEIDPSTGRLTANGLTVDLDALTSASRRSVGPVTIYWLRYARKPGFGGTPRLVVFPTDVAVEAGVGSQASAESPTRSSRAVRVALVVLGLGSLTVGGTLYLPDAVPTAVALWGSAVFGLFGLVFLWLAYAE